MKTPYRPRLTLAAFRDGKLIGTCLHYRANLNSDSGGAKVIWEKPAVWAGAVGDRAGTGQGQDMDGGRTGQEQGQGRGRDRSRAGGC